MVNKKKMFIFVLICIIVFLIFYYIFSNLVNNMNRSEDEIVEDILNKLNNYEANIDVIVKSNKTENNYNMIQEVGNGYSKMTVNAPENVAIVLYMIIKIIKVKFMKITTKLL